MARILLPVSILFLLSVTACAPSRDLARGPEPVPELPPVPDHDGPLDIQLTYPRPGNLKPNVDSTFVFGTVGTGEARLEINGAAIPVAPNGAFLAYVPVPANGIYRFAARADGQSDLETYTYATPPPPEPAIETFDTPLVATVTEGRDTLATGSQIAYAAPTPGGDRRWFFLPGTQLVATGRSDGHVRVRLTPRTEAWVSASAVSLGHAAARAGEPIGAVEFSAQSRYVDVLLDAEDVPFLVVPGTREVDIVLYGRAAPAERAAEPPSDFIESAEWTGAAADSAHFRVELVEPLWGFKAFNDDGKLVVRLRRPPQAGVGSPLEGLRVMVDPGHPPGGAIGPTGLTEAEANLDISLRLADMLRGRGAEVLMTRTSEEALASATSVATELWARVDLAVEEDADLLVSVHNNAFPDGVNPFEEYGTETYYFHPFSQPLAEALQEEIQEATGLPYLGAKQRSLALVRPSWMPSTLTESLFMMFPQQEAALENETFLERLARAHLDGIVRFLEAYLAE